MTCARLEDSGCASEKSQAGESCMVEQAAQATQAKEVPVVAAPRENSDDPLRTQANNVPTSSDERRTALAVARQTSQSDGTADLSDVEIVNLSASQKAGDGTNEAIDQKARALKEALDQKFWNINILGYGKDSPDVNKIRQILGPLTAEERRAVESRYQQLYAPDRQFDPANPGSSQLRKDLATRLAGDSTNFRLIEAILNRETNRTNDAGATMEALARMQQDRVRGESQLRAVFSTLNAKDTAALEKEFEEKYGMTLDQAMKDAGVSAGTTEFVNVFRKGADNRSADELVRLANLAIDGAVDDRDKKARELKDPVLIGIRTVEELARWTAGDPQPAKLARPAADPGYSELLKDVLAGSSPAARDARKKLLEDPSFAARFGSAFNDSFNQPDKALVDYVMTGAPELASIVQQNTGKTLGFLLDNPDSVTLATENVTEQERTNYQRGRSLQGRESDPSLSESDRTALDYYNRTREALVRGAGNQPWMADQWEANILYGKDNLIAKIAATHKTDYALGMIPTGTSHTTDDIMSAVENIAENDWSRLRREHLKNPQGGQFRADIAALLDHMAPAEKERIMALLDAKAQAKDFKDSQSIKRTVAEIGQDNTSSNILGISSTDPTRVVDGIWNMTADEAKRYRTDSAYQAQVDAMVSQSLTGAHRLLADRLLEKARNQPDGEKIKPDAIDQVLSDQIHGADPAVALKNIEAAYQSKDASGRTLFERLKSGQSGSEADQQLGRIITEAVYKSMLLPREHVEPFLATGRLSPLAKFGLDYPMEEVLATAASSTPKEQEMLRQALSPDERAILDVAIKQTDDAGGPVRLEDKLRAFIVSPSKNYEQFKEELSRLSNAEKMKLKEAYATKYGSDGKPADLDRDFLGKVDKPRQTEYSNLLSTDRGDGRQSFYDNFRQYIERSGVTVDGTELNIERAIRQQQTALEEYQRIYQTLPKEKQDLLNQYFNSAFEQYRDSKDKLSELAVNAAITAAALAAAPFSGGMSLAALGAIAATGGAFQLGVRQAMMGSDFDWSAENVTREVINGGAAAALNFVGGKQIDAAMGSAQSAGMIFGDYLVKNGVNKATARAAAIAAGIPAEALVGGTIGAVTNIGAEVVLAPVNGGTVDWETLWRSAEIGLAFGAVLPVVIKGARGFAHGGETAMKLVRGKDTFEWRPENNPGKILIDQDGKAIVVEPGRSIEISKDSPYGQVETDVVDGRLVDKHTGEPLRTRAGRYLDAQGQPIEGPRLYPDGEGRLIDVDGRPVPQNPDESVRARIEKEYPPRTREQLDEMRKPLLEDLAAMRTTDGTKSMADLLEEYKARYPEFDEERFLDIAAIIREHYMEIGGREQMGNWTHTMTEIKHALEGKLASSEQMSARAQKDFEKAMLGSMFTDSKKPPFHTHHLEGAMAADVVLRRFMGDKLSVHDINDIVKAVREHQVVPQNLMAILYGSEITSSINKEGAGRIETLEAKKAASEGLSSIEQGELDVLTLRKAEFDELTQLRKSAAQGQLGADQQARLDELAKKYPLGPFVTESQVANLKSLQDKMRRAFELEPVMGPDGSYHLDLTPEERELLRRSGTPEWYVPKPGTSEYNIAMQIIRDDALANYADVDGYGKLFGLRKPGSVFPDKSAGDAEASIRDSFEQAMRWLSPQDQALARAQAARSDVALNKTYDDLDQWIRQRKAVELGIKPEEVDTSRIPYWGTKGPDGKWTWNQLDPKQTPEDFAFAQEINDQIVDRLKQNTRVDGQLWPELGPGLPPKKPFESALPPRPDPRPEPSATARAQASALKNGDMIVIDDAHARVLSNDPRTGITVVFPGKSNVWQSPPGDFPDGYRLMDPAQGKAYRDLLDGKIPKEQIFMRSPTGRNYLVTRNMHGNIRVREQLERLSWNWRERLESYSNPDGRYQEIPSDFNQRSTRLDHLNRDDMIYDKWSGKYYRFSDKRRPPELIPEFRTYKREAVARNMINEGDLLSDVRNLDGDWQIVGGDENAGDEYGPAVVLRQPNRGSEWKQPDLPVPISEADSFFSANSGDSITIRGQEYRKTVIQGKDYMRDSDGSVFRLASDRRGGYHLEQQPEFKVVSRFDVLQSEKTRPLVEIGDHVRYRDGVAWKVKTYDAKTGDATLVRGAMRQVSGDEMYKLNPELNGIVPARNQEYNIPGTNGQVERWRYVGVNPATGKFKFVRDDVFVENVNIKELYKGTRDGIVELEGKPRPHAAPAEKVDPNSGKPRRPVDGYPALQVAGDVTPEFIEKVKASYDALPEKVKEIIRQKDIKLLVVGDLGDFEPSLLTQRPRGWSEGLMWAHSDGLARSEQSIAVVAERSLSEDGDVIFTSDSRLAYLVDHETGHVIDYVTSQFSHSEAFRQAYEADANKLTQAEKREFAYILQGFPRKSRKVNLAGREEAFSDIMSALNGHAGSRDPNRLLRKFPSVAALLRQSFL